MIEVLNRIAMRLAFQRINSKTDGVKGDFPDRTDDRYRHYQCRQDVAIPAYQNYVVSANSTKLNVHYRQAISWARTELVRLQTQLASGEAADGLEEEWDEAGEWVAALLADIAECRNGIAFWWSRICRGS